MHGQSHAKQGLEKYRYCTLQLHYMYYNVHTHTGNGGYGVSEVRIMFDTGIPIMPRTNLDVKQGEPGGPIHHSASYGSEQAFHQH
jgi:hypothetical protein